MTRRPSAPGFPGTRWKQRRLNGHVKVARPSYPALHALPSATAGGSGAVSKLLAKFGAAADRYGAALYISRDLVGVSTMLALTFALRRGLDISSWLQHWGLLSEGESTVAETAASLAGGALVASTLSPLYLLSVGRAVPYLVRVFR